MFKSSIRAWSENKTLFKGHKEHLNAKEYHHYVNKFSTQDGEFYIRFTVREAKETRWVNEGELLNNVHSAEISDIGIYKNKSVSLAGIQTGSTNALANVKKTFVDYKLAYYLEGVNINDVSIPLDPSTGEPVLSP